MRIGIIGYGSIGERHYKNIKDHGHCQVVILTKRKDVTGLPAVHSWGSFRKHGPFDAFFITNETGKHLETIRKCLTLKPRALFIEKPLSHTSRGLNLLRADLEQVKMSCWIGYNLQFFRPLMRIKKILDSGQLGRLYSLRVSVGQDLREWRKRDYRASYSSRALGGGVMLDLVHDLNYPAWLLGEPLRPVAAIIDRISTLHIKGEDCVESLYRTPSGIMVSLHQDYIRIPAKRSLEIIAERGSLEWNSSTKTIQLWVGQKHRKEKIDADSNEMYKSELAFFLKKLKAGSRFSNIREAIRDVQLIDFLKKL